MPSTGRPADRHGGLERPQEAREIESRRVVGFVVGLSAAQPF